jgi:hypothetical protein
MELMECTIPIATGQPFPKVPRIRHLSTFFGIRRRKYAENRLFQSKRFPTRQMFSTLRCAVSNPISAPCRGKVSFSSSSNQTAAKSNSAQQSPAASQSTPKEVKTPSALSHRSSARSHQTATVKVSSLRVTARYSVSRSNGSRPASVINRTRSARRIPCGVVAPAS